MQRKTNNLVVGKYVHMSVTEGVQNKQEVINIKYGKKISMISNETLYNVQSFFLFLPRSRPLS